MKSKASKAPQPFQFKQFTVAHDRCAMRITLDAVLFGAWIDASDDSSLLDVGTGSGLLALMLAQRFPSLNVTGVEIDGASADQAAANMRQSPFADRLSVQQAAIQSFQSESHYDHIISNPPFFSEHSPVAPNRRRGAARSEGTLVLQEIAEAADRLLQVGGRCSLLWPVNRRDELHDVMMQNGFHLRRHLSVQASEKKQPHRCFEEWVKGVEQAVSIEQMRVQEGGSYSNAYRNMVGEFYLDI